MKFILITAFLLLSGVQVIHEQSNIDSLTKLLAHSQEDTTKVLMLNELSTISQFYNSDTALVLADEAITAWTKNKIPEKRIKGYNEERRSAAPERRTSYYT